MIEIFEWLYVYDYDDDDDDDYADDDDYDDVYDDDYDDAAKQTAGNWRAGESSGLHTHSASSAICPPKPNSLQLIFSFFLIFTEILSIYIFTPAICPP